MTLAIARKDLVTLWTSPTPYVVGALFQSLLGVLVVNQLEVRSQAVLQPMFPIAAFLLLLTVPVLAMRSVAEELSSGSLDLLTVAGVSPLRIAMGKFAATALTTLAVLAPAGSFVVLVTLWGEPEYGPAVSGFVGLVLLAGLVSAAGTFASALTRSQPIAAMATLAAALVLWFAHRGSETVSAGSFLSAISLSERLRAFAGGGVATADVAFFVVATGVFVYLASLAIASQRIR